MASPIKLSFQSELLPLLLISTTIIISYLIYPQLPEQLASHWNFQGQVDGWYNKNTHALIMPLLMIVMYLFFLSLPYWDP